MKRILLALLFINSASSASAQSQAWQFRWQKDQVLAYKVQHNTTVFETFEGKKIEMATHLNLVKHWTVLDVDAQGSATLKLVLQAMRHEAKLPDGDILLFDSQNLEKSNPDMREQMQKYVGQTLAEIRVNSQGKVQDVKVGSAARYESDPPFAVVLPKASAKTGQFWKRDYQVVLEPPQGTGEKYDAVQRYECKQIVDGQATLAVRMEWKKTPENPQERLPLLHRENEGEVTLDLNSGRLVRAHYSLDRTIENHRGAGSSYHFRNDYTEELVRE